MAIYFCELSDERHVSKKLEIRPLQKFNREMVLDRQDKMVAEIKKLCQEKNAVILAHYYQIPEIQELADFVGDSLALAQEAAKTDADIIIFAGVHFMAETAKILNPSKMVLEPEPNAGCSLDDSCPPLDFAAFKAKHPNHTVVTYVNCSAEVKAMSDISCTSSNAVAVIESIPKDQKIIFAPDKNLGAYLAKKTGRDLTIWDGACTVHEAFGRDKIQSLKKQYPEAKFIAHPESEEIILEMADYVGSTSGLLKYVKTTDFDTYIVATEVGILHEMRKDNPGKKLIAAPANEDNTCACSECDFMKMNTIEKIYTCIKNNSNQVHIPEETSKKALKPILKMMALSKTRVN